MKCFEFVEIYNKLYDYLNNYLTENDPFYEMNIFGLKYIDNDDIEVYFEILDDFNELNIIDDKITISFNDIVNYKNEEQ